MGVGRLALDDLPVKIDRGAGTEGIELSGFRRKSGGEKGRHQQTDDTVWQLLEDESDEHVVGIIGLSV